MSGGLGSLAADASIPLKAGAGVPAPVNPLSSVGDFAKNLAVINQTKLQEQTMRSNTMSLAQQMKQLAYSHIAPLVAQGRINNLSDLTDALGGLEAHGVVTHPILEDMTRTLGMGGDFISNLKAQTVAGTQPPENAVKAIAPIQSMQDQGLIRQPFLTGAPGMPNQGVTTPVGPAIPLGAAPGTQGQPVTWVDQKGVTHSGTFAQYNEALGNGAVNGPARPAATPGGVPGAASFGNPNGGYAPQNPALRGPNAAPSGAPNPVTPGVAASGSRVMTGPDGRKWTIPAAGVAEALKHGYQ